jgi:hypothetical protein
MVEFRDDGSFWQPLREAFGFELPDDVLKLIHPHYVVAEFEHAMNEESNVLSRRSDNQLQLDINRLTNALEKSLTLTTCNCGIPGGCCYSVHDEDGNEDGYEMNCDRGEIWLESVYIADCLLSAQEEWKRRDIRIK